MRRAVVIVSLLGFASSALAGGAKKKPAPAAAPAPQAPLPAPEPPPVAEHKEWADGVPLEVQQQASALYEEGNTLFAQQAHTPALEKYTAAVALWDHPLIQYNLAVTLIRLDRILDAAAHLERALRFGDKPFKPELYQQAMDYQSLLKGRVGNLDGSCDDTVKTLLLDGRNWFSCPGSQKLRVMAGEHTIVGERPGYLTKSQTVVVPGGSSATAKMRLMPLESAVILKYRYRRWIPWTMTAVGLSVALTGLGTWFIGNNAMTQFETDYTLQCMNGCEPGLTDPSHRSLRAQESSAEFKGTLGIGMIGVGGAVAVTGIVLAIMNRPHRILPDIEVAPRANGGVTASVGWRF